MIDVLQSILNLKQGITKFGPAPHKPILWLTVIEYVWNSWYHWQLDRIIRNGIALSPNLHRAFDRGMIAISDDYTVLLHKQVKDLSSNYSVKQFENHQLHLPPDTIYYPDPLRNKDHRKRFNF